MATLDAHDDAVCRVAVYGDRLITASWDSTVKIWDYKAAASELSSAVCKRRTDDCVLAELDGVDSEVKCMDVHVDRELLVVGGSHEGRVVIWSLAGSFDVIQTMGVHEEAVNDVAFSPDGQRIVSCGNDRCASRVLTRSVFVRVVRVLGRIVRSHHQQLRQLVESNERGPRQRDLVVYNGHRDLLHQDKRAASAGGWRKWVSHCV
jgi:WD40 repeat protein